MDSLFEKAGALRPAYAAVDWASTPLGPVESWSPTLKGTLALALNTRFAVALLWGPKFTLVYNEAYADMIADKHPAALGATAETVFSEAWEVIGPMLESVRDTSAAVWQADTPLMLYRNGMLEESYFTFSYSPVTNSGGAFEGVLDIAVETTQQVISLRRLALLSRVRQIASEIEHPDQLPARAVRSLRGATPDFPEVDVVLPDRSSTLRQDAPFWREIPAHLPDGHVVATQGTHGRVAWIRMPGNLPADRRPLLAVELSEHLFFSDAYRNFIQLIADALGNAWSTAVARNEERSRVQVVYKLAEALQRSLLTEPPEIERLEIGVRYIAASQEAQIGGDWYDAFIDGRGNTSLVIGDVAGHDQRAAADMGQVRSMVRGVSHAVSGGPASVLTYVDQAIQDFTNGTLATSVVAMVDVSDDVLELRWSNAGHPPPIIVSGDGRVELLSRTPDLMLGIDPVAQRVNHTHILQPGCTLLLYTDGLVERRGEQLDESLKRLADAALRHHTLPIQEFCDALVHDVGVGAEDDIALLAVRPRH
jgi:hypothetical protein